MKSAVVGMLVLVVLVNVFAEEKTRAEAYSRIERLWRGEERPDVPNKCGLPVLGYALTHRAELQKLGLSLTTLFQRPVAQKNILRGSFRIHYDTTGVDEPAILDSQGRRIPGTANRFADSVSVIANYCLRFERDSLGYFPPPSDGGIGGGNETDIYIQELTNTYGETVPEDPINNKPDGGTFTNFIRVDNDFDFVFPDSNKGLPGLRVTLAHELHHAIQIGNYGYWTGDRYFYEISSVWMEDAVFTEVNDYYQYLRSSSGHFRHPEFSFASNEFVMYSRGIWGNYVTKKYGRDAMRKCWEEIRSVRPLLAIDAALLGNFGASFRNAFVEWATWNRFTGSRSDPVLYYPEGQFYPLIDTVTVDFTSSLRSFPGTVQPFGTRYHTIDVRVDKFPVSNLNLSAALNAPTTNFSYVLQLSTTKPDDSYSLIGGNIFAKLSVPDPNNWFMPGAAGSGSPFPNPLHADGNRLVNFPVSSTASGTLAIFSSTMDLVYSASTFPRSLYGQNVFQWNGKNDDNEIAASGIYIYVIDAGGEILTGKLALLRK